MFKKCILCFAALIIGMFIGIAGSQLYENSKRPVMITGENERTGEKEDVPGENENILTPDENDLENDLLDENKNDREKYRKILVGAGGWHRSPSMTAAYGDHYIFSEDGTFIFKYSLADEERRVIDISGNWEIINGDLLHLTIMKKTIREGGEFIPGSPSSLTGYSLVNSTTVKVDVEPYEEVIYPLRDLEIDESSPAPLMLKIGGVQYWKWGGTADETLVMEQTNEEPDIDSEIQVWEGVLEFSESAPPDQSLSYTIKIYKENNEYYGDISIDGFQTMNRIRTKAVGDKNSVNLVFDTYLPDNVGERYEKGDILLSLERKGQKVYTSWGKLQPMFQENKQSGEVYFEYR